MHSVSNRSRVNQQFQVKGGAFVTLAPGESKSLALADRDAPYNTGREHAGVIAIASSKAAAAKAKPPKYDPGLPETTPENP